MFNMEAQSCVVLILAQRSAVVILPERTAALDLRAIR